MKKTALHSIGTISGRAVLFGAARARGVGRWAALLPAIAVFLCLAHTAFAELPPRPKGTGMLISVEANGTVIIAERGHANEDGSQDSIEHGYRLSPHALILDTLGKKTSLEKMSLPTVVAFEYVYTREGPEIRLIREMAQ
ncbi:MAG TPA: hypothetical protein VN604_11250 [Nitrospirota bacterium]|nr:hypothetical protein [Nitrospirota bacterium]